MSDGSFLSRWSRRKQAVARGAAPAEPAPPEATAPLAEAPPAALPEAAEAMAEEAFDVTALPSIESLTADSDVTAFLARGVPELLKRQALRRIWSLDTGIRDFVGPADYAWDFNAPDTIPGFSLHLSGDLKKLLAQAIGMPPEPEEEAADAPPDVQPVPEARPADPAEPPPEPPHLAVDATAEASPEEPAPPRRQRHGSAMPS